MKLVNLEHREDYVRFNKSLTIEVNDLITVEADCCGGVVKIDSKLFGKVTTLEDADTDLIFYVGGKQTKYQGFKELYNKLFVDDYETFAESVYRFVENQILNTYEDNINSLITKQKIKLLREQIDIMPRFESTCKQTIVYRQWGVNQVLNSLNAGYISSKYYERLDGRGSSYGIELWKLEEIYQQLKNK